MMWSSVKNQLRSVIEWQNPGTDLLFEKWSSNSDEIKNASQLIVGPGQGCVFVYQGRVEAVFLQSGLFQLKTDNIPFWTTITKFMQAFQSEHKVGVYFFKTTQVTNLKWGTSSTIKYEDPKYKFPVGLRAFGNFSVQIDKAEWFFQNILGSQDGFTTLQLRDLVVSRIIQPLTDILAQEKLTYSEIDSQRNELSQKISAQTLADFALLGFKLLDFRIEGTSFDDETMKRINRIADMSAEAQAAQAVGLNFAQLQQLDAMKEAAKNPGGAGMIMGVGLGQNLAGQVVGGLQSINEDPALKLKKLKDLYDQGLITADDYDKKKKDILDKM